MKLSGKRDYGLNYEWTLSSLPQLSTILALASLLLLKSLPSSSSPSSSSPQTFFSFSLALSLSTSLNICENECKDLISLKTRVYICST